MAYKSTSQKLPFLNTSSEYILHVHVKKMSEREMVYAEVNAGSFLKSFQIVGDFTRQFIGG